MFKVKICGITCLEDALWAIDCGADALGFVFYEKSPRYIDIKRAKEITSKLPPFIHKVGLFVNEDSDKINQICSKTLMSIAQIHFEASSKLYNDLKIPHMKVVRAKRKDDIFRYQDQYKIVDAFVESYGGEGKRVDESWFDGVDNSKIILAGGLNPKNVGALKRFGFYGFDVSSGVELKKGKKDKNRVKKFIDEVKLS